MNTRFFILALILTTLSLNQALGACTTSTDDYAAEVVLNKPDITYNLACFSNADNLVIQENQYIMHSSTSPLILILEKQSELTCGYNSGLSVRLQIPLKAENVNLPYLKFSSTNTKNSLNIIDSVYDGWQISCFQGNPIPQCEFKKSGTSILASLIGNKYEATVEITNNLGLCSEGCDGKCIGTRCINKQLKGDIQDILEKAGLIDSFDAFAASYRVISSGNIAKIDLIPQSTDNVDWKAALKKELKNLNNENVISISDEDINSISELAKQGAAGVNSRIVYDGEKWSYYYQTKFASLTKLVNCREYPLSLVPTGAVIIENPLPTYYLVPIIMTVALVILLVLLVAVARITDASKRRHRLKPVTGLQSSKS